MFHVAVGQNRKVDKLEKSFRIPVKRRYDTDNGEMTFSLINAPPLLFS